MLGIRFALAPLAALVVVAASVLVVWFAYVDAGDLVSEREPPLVKAATKPLKRSPDDPGGSAVADLGGVGDLIDEGEGDDEERLLPRTERPLTASEAGASSASNNPGDAAAALEALVTEIRSNDVPDANSGAGGPSPNDKAANAAPAVPEPRARTAEAIDQSSTDADGGSEDETVVAATRPTFEATDGGRFRVQLAAVREEADAERAWELFRDQLGPFIKGLKPFFERAETSNGVFYRVQIGPFAETNEADRLCAELKKQDASCFVVAR